MNLAERLRKAREHAGISQRKLAMRCAELGHVLSMGQIGKLELGERTNPRASDVEALARATGVSHVWLLKGEGPMLSDAPEVEEIGAFDAARNMFIAQEAHEGRGEPARAFLASRSVTYAGAEGRSPGWWLETLREEFRAWRASSKVAGSRELELDEEPRPSKVNARRA